MDKPTIKCALLSTMLAKHRWGTPISREDLIRLSAVGDDYPAARDVYDDLRSQPYITNHGKRGITLNNSQFNELADVLYHEGDDLPGRQPDDRRVDRRDDEPTRVPGHRVGPRDARGPPHDEVVRSVGVRHVSGLIRRTL